jgi:hypothetical protein
MDVAMEHRTGYLYISMSGEYVDDIPGEGRPASMARACLDNNYRCLLIDTRGLASEVGYFRRGEDFARAFAFNVIRIAIVGNKEQARSLSFFEKVVTNRGIHLRTFTDIDEAAEWLVA